MKKIAMQAIKRVVGLLPKPLKAALKRSTKLTELYSSGIRKSGLFYGVPSEREQNLRYKRICERQLEQFRQLPGFGDYDLFDCNVVLIGGSKTDISRSLTSLKTAGVDVKESINVTVKGGEVEPEKQACFSFKNVPEHLKSSRPVFFLKSGDTVDPSFGALCASLPTAEVLYFDTDKSEKHGGFSEPRFLPDWNPELQLSNAYINNGVLVSADILRSLNLTKCDSIAAVMANIALNAPSTHVQHVPHTVIHANEQNIKDRENVCSVANWLKRASDRLVMTSETNLTNNLLWTIDDKPLVSLIIPTKDGKALVKACIESIIEKSLYDNYEILLIDNGSTEPESLEYFKFLDSQPKIRVLKYPGPFNYSAINNFGVQHAKGEVIGLINNDIEVISPLWLDYMVGHALRDDIGCVGAKLLYSDGRVQHAGVVLGYGGGAGHAHKYFPRYHPGYLNRLAATQNYSAVTAACLLVRKSLFEEVGGLNEKDLAVAFNDVDFCLRIRELGKRNVYCAEAELFHHESVSRGLDIAPEKAARFNRELAYLQNRWANVIAHDPAYSPNLTLRSENFAIKEEREYISSSDS